MKGVPRIRVFKHTPRARGLNPRKWGSTVTLQLLKSFPGRPPQRSDVMMPDVDCARAEKYKAMAITAHGSPDGTSSRGSIYPMLRRTTRKRDCIPSCRLSKEGVKDTAHVHVNSLGVFPEHQRQRVGRRLPANSRVRSNIRYTLR